MKFQELGAAVGAFADKKNELYGSSFAKTGAFLELLFPNGVQPHQYTNLLTLARMFDKMNRIATDKDKLEDPWADLTGYSLLALDNDLNAKNAHEEFINSIKQYIVNNTPE